MLNNDVEFFRKTMRFSLKNKYELFSVSPNSIHFK